MEHDERADLTAEDMKEWLKEETAEVQVASKRRLLEATALVEAYEKGQLTPIEADEKWREYLSRWPQKLANDEELEQSIEEEAAKISGARLGSAQRQRHR
jgi:hypothetical protein